MKNRLREVEMMKRRVAPTAIIVWKSKIRRTEIGGGDNNGTRKTPFLFTNTFHFETSPTA